MSGAHWTAVPLASVTTKIGSGATPRGGRDAYRATGMSLIRSMNVHDNRFRWDDLALIGDEQAAALDNVAVEADDVLLNITGASVARCCSVPVSALPARVNQHVALVRADRDHAIGKFIEYALTSPRGKSRLLGIAQGGATREALTKAALERFTIELPPLAIQRKVATILAVYDDLVENNNRRIKLLEEMSQCIYREWFVDFRYPGHANVPLVDSELGPIPQGWSVRTIEEVAASERYAVTSGPFGSKLGGKDYRTDGVPVIRGSNLAVGGNFRDSDFVFVSAEKADEMKSCLARPGDIVVTQRGTLGQVGLIPERANYERYVLSQSQMKITVGSSDGGNEYLYASLRSPEVTARLQARAMTAGVPHINLTILRQFPVVWPDVAVQSRAADTFRLLGQQVLSLQGLVGCLRATRDLLLPRLISGEVDVSDLDIAIPGTAA